MSERVMPHIKLCCKCHKDISDSFYIISGVPFDIGYYCEKCVLLRKLAGVEATLIHYDYGCKNRYE